MSTPAPQVVTWVKVYEGALALVYLLVAVAGLFFIVGQVPTNPGDPPPALMGGVFLVISVPLAIANLAALFVRPTPNTWVFHLVLICLGMTSACCLLVCVPLLIFWLRPETKAYFGRS